MQTLKYVRVEEEKGTITVGPITRPERSFGLMVQLSDGGASEMFFVGDEVDLVAWRLRQLADRLEAFDQQRNPKFVEIGKPVVVKGAASVQ